MIVGTEWLIEATGCNPASLRDEALLRVVFDRVVAGLGLKAIDSIWHTFPGEGGVTGLVALTESHLACHTYPEHGTATFNLYCCRTRPEWDWESNLKSLLGARTVSVMKIERGDPFEISNLKSQIPEQKSETSNLKSQSANQKSEISNLKSQISNQKSEISDLKSQIPGQKSEISNFKSQIPIPKSEISNFKSQIPIPKSEISNLKSQIPDQKSEISNFKSQTAGGDA